MENNDEARMTEHEGSSNDRKLSVIVLIVRHSFIIGHSTFVIFEAPHDTRRKRLRPRQRKLLSEDYRFLREIHASL